MSDQFTVQLSADLINRFATDSEKLKRKTKKAKPKISEEPHKSQSKVKPALTPNNGGQGGGWPLQPPMFLPLSTPPPPSPPPPPVEIAELQAIRSVLQESEKVMERLEKQETTMVQELNQRAKELREKEFKLPYQKPIPCFPEREACLQCYKEKHPLKCAEVVRAFADCVHRARQQQDGSTQR